MEKLKELPFSFQRKHKSKCGCCETIKEETITYELKLDFKTSFDVYNKEHKKFVLYYSPKYYCNFSENPEIIGERTGLGEASLDELVDELKILINKK